MLISYQKIRDNAIIPTKKSDDGGWDLYAAFEAETGLLIPSLESRLVSVGFKTVIPTGVHGYIKERGSTGVKNIKVNAGLIDSGYRGEWFVCIYNGNKQDLILTNEDKVRQAEYVEDEHIVWDIAKAIAQVSFIETVDMEWLEAKKEDFNKITTRGESRLGASGK